jgi:hypothetical protein
MQPTLTLYLIALYALQPTWAGCWLPRVSQCIAITLDPCITALYVLYAPRRQLMAETHARITVVQNEAPSKACQQGDELLNVSIGDLKLPSILLQMATI